MRFWRLWKLLQKHIYDPKHQPFGNCFLPQEVTPKSSFAKVQFRREFRYSADLERGSRQDSPWAVDPLHRHLLRPS